MCKKLFNLLFGKKNEEEKEEKVILEENKIKYQSKCYYSNYEKTILTKLNSIIENKYLVYPQVNLVSIIDKIDNSKYRTELFRNIDFGIFDKTTAKPLLLIELNDATHKNAKRYQRDIKVKEILKQANIPLITLYASYENAESYIKKRINEFIKI